MSIYDGAGGVVGGLINIITIVVHTVIGRARFVITQKVNIRINVKRDCAEGAMEEAEMTDEELRKKAEEKFCTEECSFDRGCIYCTRCEDYIAGAKENTLGQDCIKLTEDNIVMARQRAETSRKLTKAKKIIKRLMHELTVSNRPYGEIELLVKDVEQFLEEAEE